MKSKIKRSSNNDQNFSKICEAIAVPIKVEIFQDCFERTVHANVITSEDYYDKTNNAILEAKAVMPSEMYFDSTYSVQETSGYSRPMLIYCHILKPIKDYPIGLHIKYEDDIIRISQIDKNSLLDRAKCLIPGDQIVAINGCAIRGMNTKQIYDVIRNAIGSISFTIRNNNGDPTIVLNSIQNTGPQCKVGVAFRNDWNNRAKLIISSINDDSPYNSSLLCIGQQVIAIQDIPCSNLLAADAAELCHEVATGYYHITILSTAKSYNNNIATVISYEIKRKYFINQFNNKLKRGLLKLHNSPKSLFNKSTTANSKTKGNRVGANAIADTFDTMISNTL